MAATSVLETRTERASAIGDRCEIYRSEFGFDTYVDPMTGAIHAATVSLSGAMMSPRLGQEVVGLLDTVAVISIDQRKHRLWTLLAEAPASPHDTQRMALQLFTLNVTPVFRRGAIALPTPGDPHRVWLQPPRGRTRPTLAALCEAIATAATGKTAGNR